MYLSVRVPNGPYSSNLCSRVIVESLEWIATPEADMTFWRERSKPSALPENSQICRYICTYYKATDIRIVSLLYQKPPINTSNTSLDQAFSSFGIKTLLASPLG